MARVITIDYDRCIGCKTCETACSLVHEGRINPAEARINVARYEQIGVNIPVTCHKCEDPICMAVCPQKAITFDPALGTRIDHSRCIGCKLCIMACPMGGVSLNPTSRQVIICDLCQGTPECVKVCPEQALEYVDSGIWSQKKRREAVSKLSRFLEETIQ
jgi:Fe-S-cluster-containing hydrogenase component 2